MKRIILFFSFLVAHLALFASNFSVKATLDSTQLLIGEQAKLIFEVEQPKELSVQMPLFSDSIVSGLEIVDYKRDTQFFDNENQIKVSNSYTVTSFDSALYFIPPYNFVGDETLQSNSLVLKVITIPVDTAQHAITDIKPVYKPPFDWVMVGRIALGVVLAALVALLIYLGIKKWKKRSPEGDEEIKKEPSRPAHEIAVEQLNALKDKKLWQQEKTKEYHTQLVDILRIYAENRFEVSAMEQTSFEFLNEIRPFLDKKDGSFEKLRQILSLADLVKFAKWNPLPEENDKSLNAAYEFVDVTKKVEIAEEKSVSEKVEKVEN